jgi:hypothetical protein
MGVSWASCVFQPLALSIDALCSSQDWKVFAFKPCKPVLIVLDHWFLFLVFKLRCWQPKSSIILAPSECWFIATNRRPSLS